MKHSFHFVFLATLTVASCNNQSTKSAEEASTGDTSKPAENKVMIPESSCYISITGKDSVFFKMEVFPNVVTGSLSYRFFEKDSNTGDIDGKLNGDTLVADYTFMSEGKQSTRQVAFLVKDTITTAGYGPMEEKDGRMVFKNLSELDFTKGMKFRKIPCPAQ